MLFWTSEDFVRAEKLRKMLWTSPAFLLSSNNRLKTAVFPTPTDPGRKKETGRGKAEVYGRLGRRPDAEGSKTHTLSPPRARKGTRLWRPDCRLRAGSGLKARQEGEQELREREQKKAETKTPNRAEGVSALPVLVEENTSVSLSVTRMHGGDTYGSACLSISL